MGHGHEEKVRNLRGKEVYNLNYEEHVTEAGIIAGGKNVLESGGNVTITGGRFAGSVGSSISGANISLLAVQLQNQQAEEVKKGNMLMNTQSGQGHSSRKIKPVEIVGPVTFNSRGAINIEIESGKKPAWVVMLENRAGVNVQSLERVETSYSYKTRQLTPEAQVLVGVAVAAATGGVGSTLGAGFASSIGASVAVTTGISSAVAAGVSGLASSVVIGAANSGGNVLKGIKSATSKESLKSLGKNMLAAGVISGISAGTGFGDVAEKAKEFGVAGRNQAIFERVLLRTAVNSAVIGGDIRGNLKREAQLGALAVGQGYIGDIGEAYGLAEGSAAKIVMHAGLGAGYASATGNSAGIGALAGGMAEALGGITSPAAAKHEFSGTGASGTGLSNWIDTAVAATSMLAGGSASDISTATTVSSSVVEYNGTMHRQAILSEAFSASTIQNTGEYEASWQSDFSLPKLPQIFPNILPSALILMQETIWNLTDRLESAEWIDNKTSFSIKIASVIPLLVASDAARVSDNSSILKINKNSKENKNKTKTQDKVEKQKQTGTGAPMPPDDEKQQEKEKQLKKDERKFNLDRNNLTERNILENLDTSVEDFIVKERKGSIKSEFPSQYLNSSLREILDKAMRGDRAAITAKKLLMDQRFLK